MPRTRTTHVDGDDTLFSQSSPPSSSSSSSSLRIAEIADVHAIALREMQAHPSPGEPEKGQAHILRKISSSYSTLVPHASTNAFIQGSLSLSLIVSRTCKRDWINPARRLAVPLNSRFALGFLCLSSGRNADALRVHGIPDTRSFFRQKEKEIERQRGFAKPHKSFTSSLPSSVACERGSKPSPRKSSSRVCYNSGRI